MTRHLLIVVSPSFFFASNDMEVNREYLSSSSQVLISLQLILDLPETSFADISSVEKISSADLYCRKICEPSLILTNV
jgi:hypothetical protein